MILNGVWDFFPGDYEFGDLGRLEPEPIRVPGLWEAQGWLDLDGVAWYRRRFKVIDGAGYWTLRFGAVMDFADVFLNGVHVGSHESPFTPFELDVSGRVVAGENELAVRVVDPPLGDPEQRRMPHGKQGWGNEGFPSRPSLYMTYGGIWQSVTLERHGPVVVRDVFVNGDPDDLRVSLDVCNRATTRESVDIVVATLGRQREIAVDLAPSARRTLAFDFGRTEAPLWSPREPLLHEALVEAVGSDRQSARFGLRTVRIDGRRILVNGEPYRLKGVLVQGFRAEELYAEGSRDAIREEVVAAKELGFNTLRLHVKAFDPAYLEVCDEVGMFLHCDVPVAEPVDYAELGADTVLARRCVAAAREQVQRDRNHPSILLWSAMNEVGERRPDVRTTPAYQAFVRRVVAAIGECDPTRPVIENDWVEPDPARVLVSPVLTAHWYGRLHRDYLHRLERKAQRANGLDRPLLVTEYGDWGLPDMPELPDAPFWDTREAFAAGAALELWPGTVESFVAATQYQQGLGDRLQAEILRRHDHISGQCLTELTDVPHELNGLLDLHRRAKEPAAAEMAIANQVVLPMLDLRTLVVRAGERVRAPLHVANDGPALGHVEIDVAGERVFVGELPAHRASALGDVTFAAPTTPGRHEIRLRLTARGGVVAENRYPLHVVDTPSFEAIAAVVEEDALDAQTAAEVRERLGRGETVVVLAQPVEAARWYPVPIGLRWIDTRWGGSMFHFTTPWGELGALPRGGLLAIEDSTVHATALVVAVDGRTFPEQPMVVRYNPRGNTGTLVGAHPVGPGRLVFCQYRLAARAAAGDAMAAALLADVVRLATVTEPLGSRTSAR